MSQRQPSRPSPLLRAVKRYSVSAFVICSFSAYAVHERMLSADAAAVSQAPGAAITRQVAALPQPRQATAAAVAAKPMQIAATKATPVQMLPPAPPAATVSGTYRDGEYTGAVADAYYGNVQVKAVVRSGQLADVSFLTYPNHRRTSVRINDYAMPYLTSEAVQAQSANVNIISGATLTSEAFAQSLQSALDAAKS